MVAYREYQGTLQLQHFVYDCDVIIILLVVLNAHNHVVRALFTIINGKAVKAPLHFRDHRNVISMSVQKQGPINGLQSKKKSQHSCHSRDWTVPKRR